MYHRNSRGQFASWRKRILGFAVLALIGAYFIFGHPLVMSWLDKSMYSVRAVNSFTAEAAEDNATKTAQELREEMIAIIWDGESDSYQPKAGEVFHTYDPDRAMRESGVCLREGGKRPIDCDSYGVMQIKIGTLQDMYPQVYGESISQIDAIMLTQDPARAKQFAVDCWVKVEGCVWRWTTAEKHAEYFNTVLPIIRKLEQ